MDYITQGDFDGTSELNKKEMKNLNNIVDTKILRT
jgi:hypothetical protein